MARILFADDHEIFRKGVKQILTEMSDAIFIDEANNGQEVIEKIWSNDYDAVLLDISMPGRNGLDVLKDIKNNKPALRVLMLSMYPEEQFAMRALKAKADGYLTKAASPDELKRAIQMVIKGKKYISSSLAESLACHVEGDCTKPIHERLSDREYEVLFMTVEGKPVKQIARELSLSDKTVSTYRARILNKMNINTIARLIQYAIQHNLLNQPRA